MTGLSDGEPRVPPHDIMAEQGVLGSMILSAEAFSTARTILRVEDFYTLSHQDIFEAILTLGDEGKMDVVLLKSEMESRGTLDKAGGVGKLLDILAAVPTSSNVEYYAHIVLEKAQQRHLAVTFTALGLAAYSPEAQVDEIKTRAVRCVADCDNRTVGRPVFADQLADAQAKFEQQQDGIYLGVPSGIAALDARIGGFEPSTLSVIGGLPGSGKTALGTAVLLHTCCERKRPAIFFSAEMAQTQLLWNLHRQLASVPFRNLASKRLTLEELTRWQRATERLKDAPLELDCTGGIAIEDLVPRALATVEKRSATGASGAELILVDYIQILRTSAENTRVLQVAYIGLELKALAERAGVPVLALSQVTRQEGGHMELRWAREIEHAADMVMFLRGKPEYEKHEAPEPDVAYRKLLITKNRYGPQASVELDFDKPRLTFCEHKSSGEETARTIEGDEIPF